MRNKVLTLLQYVLLIGGLIFSLYVMVTDGIRQDIIRKKIAISVDWAGPLCSACGGTEIRYFYDRDGVAIGECIYCETQEVMYE